jgi:predicted short-subunit dehydrogenase-like oxidoreductase (DUF2520 family)
MANSNLRISIAGSGKMAQAMGLALKNAGVVVVEVASRNKSKLSTVAAALGAKGASEYADMNTEVDAIAVLVSDDAISEVSSMLPVNIPRFHASGVTDIKKLGGDVQGVVWPIKSINAKSLDEGFAGVPIGIEANTPEFSDLLHELANRMGGEGFVADYKTRSTVHLAAVFTDNFANHCLTLSQEVLKEADLDPKLMKALAQGLTQGALNGESYSRQTGVALRGDTGSQEKHLELLSSDELKAFYKFLSTHIKDHHEL